MSVIDSALHLGKTCASAPIAEHYRLLRSRVRSHALTTFMEARWRQFASVTSAIATMRQVVQREQGVPSTLRNEIEDALSSAEIAEFEEETRVWTEVCNLVQNGVAKNVVAYEPFVAALSKKLGGKIEDIRPPFEELRESVRSSTNFRRVQEIIGTAGDVNLLQSCRESFDKCMEQISRKRIFPVSEEALLFIYENHKEANERKCVLVLYGLETTLRLIDQVIYQCVIDGGLPEFDSDHHIVKVESSHGMLVTDISLTLAIHFHPGLRVGSIFRIQAENAPDYVIALGIVHHFHRETGGYMDISGLALDKDGLTIPLPPSSDKTK